MEFFFEAKSAHPSDRVVWFYLVNYLSFDAVSYGWSLVLQFPNVSCMLGLVSLSFVLDVGPVSIPSSLEWSLVHSSISFICVVIHPCYLSRVDYIHLCSASPKQWAFIYLKSHKITVAWQFLFLLWNLVVVDVFLQSCFP